ncbi:MULTISPECIES: hypothetical protein [Enterococcus]|uniref:Uncharacterized protein n=1 Tax=Enterococcus entomosocium TaxID=3034352 RepID=A0ABV3M7Q8_9ENTE|nr:hypothetical protein [Enterococcus casseliflavus]MDB1709415.1 hypothetical protein [Enterococcus casseliflavus]MDB1717229.1 hypothetical protein [Enterococcus casseliflavus]
MSVQRITATGSRSETCNQENGTMRNDPNSQEGKKQVYVAPAAQISKF